MTGVYNISDNGVFLGFNPKTLATVARVSLKFANYRSPDKFSDTSYWMIISNPNTIDYRPRTDLIQSSFRREDRDMTIEARAVSTSRHFSIFFLRPGKRSTKWRPKRWLSDHRYSSTWRVRLIQNQVRNCDCVLLAVMTMAGQSVSSSVWWVILVSDEAKLFILQYSVMRQASLK